MELLKNSYAAPFETLNFKNDPAAAARHINAWVEEQTRQRIRDLVPEPALTRLTRLLLVNAVYLKTPWANPFEIEATKPGSFFVNGTSEVQVPMMHQTDELLFAEGKGFVAVNLGLTYSLRFLIFLPANRTGLRELEQQVSPDLIAGKLKWERREVILSMPRFKLEPPALSLSAALQSLGMKTAFDIPLRSANFDRMAARHDDEYLAISDVFHKTFLNLDEKGIEAAAATAVAVEGLASVMKPPKPVEVRVEHPFLFAITTQATRELNQPVCLFLGHITDPR